MRYLVAILLLASVVGIINGQTKVATRAPATRITTKRAVAPTRQALRPGMPMPSRVPTTRRPVSPTRQAINGGPVPITRPGAQTVRPGPQIPTTTRRPGPQVPTTTRRPGPQPPTTTRRPGPQPPTTTRNPGPTVRPTPQQPGISVSPPTPPIIVTPNVPTGPPSGRSTTRSPRVGLVGVPDPRCPSNQNSRQPVHLPHQSNCERFYKCDHGMAYEYQCPVGQHWNSFRNYCDFPNNANCGGLNNNWNTPPRNNWVTPPSQIWNTPPSNNWVIPPNDNWISPPDQIWLNRPEFQHPINIPMAPGK